MNMVDMSRSEDDVEKYASPLMESKYPYGLQISLNEDSLDKLGVDISDWEIGDVFPLDILAKVVSKSANETEGGKSCCNISLQITHIGGEEAEQEDGDETSLAKHGYNRIKYGE